MRAFKFRADADTAGAENAAVVVQHKSRMGEIDGQRGEIVGEMHGVDAEGGGHGLQLAMSIGNAYGANVIAFDEQQFDGDAAILRELGRIGGDGHAVLNRRGARGEEAVDALYFDDAQAASADGGEAVEIAQRGNVFSGSFGRLQDRLAFQSADQLAVDANGQFFLRQGVAPFVSSRQPLPSRSAGSGRTRREPLRA